MPRNRPRNEDTAFARIHGERDEASCPTQFFVIAEQIIPIVQQGLEEGIDVKRGADTASSTACQAAPILAVTIRHVLADIGIEAGPQRFEPLFDPLLGGDGFLVAHVTSFTCATEFSRSNRPERMQRKVLCFQLRQIQALRRLHKVETDHASICVKIDIHSVGDLTRLHARSRQELDTKAASFGLVVEFHGLSFPNRRSKNALRKRFFRPPA